MGFLLDEGIELFINYIYQGHSGSLPSGILIILTHSISGWKDNCRTILWVVPVEDNSVMYPTFRNCLTLVKNWNVLVTKLWLM